MRRGKRRIDIHRALVGRQRTQIEGLLARLVCLGIERQSLEIRLVGWHRCRTGRHHVGQRLGIHGDLHRACDFDGEIFLDGDDVVGTPVVRLRPQMKAIACANQLCRHAQTVFAAAHGAFEYVSNTQGFCNLSNALAGALVSKR